MRVLAVALACVFGAVDTAPEPGLLTGCRIANRINYDGRCFDVRWAKSRMPLQVYANELPLVEQAIDRINAELGFSALAVWDMRRAPDVFVAVNVRPLTKRYNGGVTQHYYSEGRFVAAIATWGNESAFTEYLVLLHEFGHVLGLAHDPRPESMMFPRIPAEGHHAIALTGHDRQLLRGLYALP